MSLPIPNLDDRTYDDLMKESRSLIPRYNKEWTNYNPSDPGITLLELFSWLGEMVIYRINRVPEESYINFLKLIASTPNEGDPETLLESSYIFNWNNLASDEKRFRNFLKTELDIDWADKVIISWCWDNIPGNDDSKLIDSLRQKFGIDWVKKAKIEKINNDSTIRVSTEENSLVLELNDDKTRVELVFDDGRTGEFTAKMENGKLNIYIDRDDINKTLLVSLGKDRVEIILNEIIDESEGRGYGNGYLKINGARARYLHVVKKNDELNIYNVPDLDEAYKELLTFLKEIEDGRKKNLSEIKGAPVDFMDSMYRVITTTDFEEKALDCMRMLLKIDSPGRAICMNNLKLVYSDEYIFSWDKVPGNNSESDVEILTEYLVKKFDVEWIKTVKFEKIDSDMTIKASAGQNLLLLKLSGDKTSVTLEINGGKADEFTVKTENDKLKVYSRENENYLVNEELPGHVSVVIVPRKVENLRYCEDEGKPTDLLKEEVKAYLDARRLITTRVHVVNPIYHKVKLRVQLVLKENTKENEVLLEADRRIKKYFNPLTGGPEGTGWPPGRNVYRSELYDLLEGIPDVDHVEKIWINSDAQVTKAEIEKHQLISLPELIVEKVSYE